MGDYIQILALTVAGLILLWFGYQLFFGSLSSFFPAGHPWKKWGKKKNIKGEPGDPQVCPICSIKLDKGEMVKTLAFPSITGGRDRLMYIRGCYNCLKNNVPRKCPVCGENLSVNDFLISRMFERPNKHNHVHVIGCNHCRKTT